MDGNDVVRRIIQFIVALVIVVLAFQVMAYILGCGEAEAAQPNSRTSFCNKYPSHAACKPGSRIARIEMVTVVKPSAAARYPKCFTAAKRRKYINDLGAVLFWTQVDQVMCADSRKTRIAQVLPAVTSSWVSLLGNLIGFDVSEGRISSGPMPWRNHPKGSYRSEAAFRVVQKGCVPILNVCQTLRAFTHRIWIRGFADGTWQSGSK